MNTRSLLALAVFVLLAAACGEASSTGPMEGGTMLRYGFLPGDVFVYDADIEMTMDMVMSQAGIAADVDMAMTATERITYSHSEGPTPDTVEVVIYTEVLDGETTMEMMGTTEYLPIEEVSGDLEVPMSFLVDAQGTVLETSVGGQTVPVGLFSDSMFGGGNAMSSQPVGPQLPDYAVAVGSVWTTDISNSVFGKEISQHGRHEIVAAGEIDDRTVMRIESRITTGRMTLGWDQLMDMAVEGVALSGQDPAEMEALVQMMGQYNIDMIVVMQESTLFMTTWFDLETGTVLRLFYDMPMEMEITMSNVPDAGDMDMTASIDMTQYLELAG